MAKERPRRGHRLQRNAAALTRWLESFLFETTAFDPVTFTLTALLLALVATVASYVPARRGTRVAPTEALRMD